MEYANNNYIILKINEKNKDFLYPFLCCTLNNNIEMIQLLIDYASINYRILRINGEDRYQRYPILCSIGYKNVDLINIIIEYAIKNQIVLRTTERDIAEANKISNDIVTKLNSFKNNLI